MATVSMETELGHMSVQMLFCAITARRTECRERSVTNKRLSATPRTILIIISVIPLLLHTISIIVNTCCLSTTSEHPLVVAYFLTCVSFLMVSSAQVLDWIENHGEAFLSKHTGVGKSLHRARALQKRHEDFEEVAQVAFSHSHCPPGSSQYIKYCVDDDICLC